MDSITRRCSTTMRMIQTLQHTERPIESIF